MDNKIIDNKQIISEAKDAMSKSYSPYSNFRVGAALLAKSGKVYKGCNVENSSYGATCCAERNAIFKAVSEGDTEYVAIAITSDSEDYTYPCGICRQVISEFSDDLDIVLTNKEDEIKIYKLNELIPHSFNKHTLKG